MHRFSLLLAAAGLAIASPAFAQDGGPETAREEVVVTGSRIVRQRFDCISRATTDPAYVRPEPSWRCRDGVPGSRLEAHEAGGASPVWVIRACEISLKFGDDEDCARPSRP